MRAERRELGELRQELIATRQFLQSLIDEHQSTIDDLAGANEELVASNEELQSTNEEQESAKEELQSANEELSTVNDETRSRNEELDVLATDLANVLESVAIPMVIVDAQRRIRRFTPKARGILNLIPADVQRPVGDITLNVEVADLDGRIAAVVETGQVAEWEAQDRAGRWHRIQIRPYRTAAGQVDGAVVSMVDIDDLRRSTTAAERVNQSKDLFLATLSHELRSPLAVILLQAQVLQTAAARGRAGASGWASASCCAWSRCTAAWRRSRAPARARARPSPSPCRSWARGTSPRRAPARGWWPGGASRASASWS